MQKVLASGALLVSLVVACSKPPPASVDAESGKTGSTSVKPDKPAESNVHVDPAIAKACSLPSPRFGFDSTSLERSAALDLLAQCFASGAMKDKALRLVGHANPRGETEYNIALGQRRAGALERYLVDRGVMSQRVQSSSQGEFEATGTDEATWANDRRVDVLLAR